MSRNKTHKLLVANRSEIACRIFQGAQELGIPTVAVFAPGDEQARHVTMADEVAQIPTYLDGAAIIEVARKLGVTMIHPAYGFLSERSHFAKAVEEAGIIFLGPLAETMDAMGGKIAAKEIAEKIGVPTVPWARLDFAKSTESELKAAAEKVGYPILIKAHAGGGGKGMRKVTKFSELKESAESAAREALNSFGDGTLFFERYVTNPRHIEVQVFGDGRGSGVHLYERECTLQRRHQKVWEEAPAPNLSQATRDGLYESALKLLKHTRYRSAGTIEFLVNDQGEYFFIEMNTRLQVEHPVTEQITGIDLVHEQIKLGMESSAYKLPVVSEPRGHAIEVRVYAEDPAQEFIPCTGKVTRLIWPAGPGIRLDRGIEVGQEMGTNFDSMCAKVIVHAPIRELAVKRMQFALKETVIGGIGSNLEYLNTIAHHPSVMSGEVTTAFLDQEMGSFSLKASDEELQMIAAFEKSAAFHDGATVSPSGARTNPKNAEQLWSSLYGELKR